MTVIDLDDHRAHFTIPDLSGNVHVVPVALIESWIADPHGIMDGEEWEPVLSAIIDEWKRGVTG